ncbi:hypothetical protein EI94DRAFT_1784320 [Lactarius quietus]|nr:hypothetical protein EI94DRAFT_1784320 [Lactarius quietus]
MADSFSLLVNDASPALTYFPFSDTLSIPNLFAGWNPCFSNSSCSTYPGQQGNGTSFHITSRDGAAFSVQWWGNGIQLSGYVTGPITYDLELDGQKNTTTPSPGTTLLAAYENLQPTNHTLSLIVHNPTNSSTALIEIYNALINVNSTSPNITFSTTTIDDTALPFTGRWSFFNDSSLSPLDSTYHTTSNAGDFVSLNFSGTAISVFGFRDTTSGNFSVQLDNETVVLNAASSSIEATTLFFRTGLNESVPHTLIITNEVDGLLAIGSVNITTASSNSPNPISALSSHVSRGTIVAITLAAILGTLVLLISSLCLWRRRRQFGRILHERRLFVPPNGNDHSKVLDIVRGPEFDDFDDMYHDKGPTGISRRTATSGSGSLSFTLDLPIQSRPSLPPSRGDYSGNSAQELPRSPTVSVGRTGTHVRESSRGVPFPEVFAVDGGDNGGVRRPPLPDVPDLPTSTVTRISPPTQDQETREEHAESQSFELSPVVPAPALPRVSAVAGVIPSQEPSERSQPSYSFLDISASSRGSSVRHTGPNAESSSSSSGSMQRRNQEPLSSTRRISLPFALGFPTGLRDRTERSDPSSANIEFPQISTNIRPLPQIPQGMVGPDAGSPEEIPKPPRPPRRVVRPHAQSTPPLHIRTQVGEPQQLPRSVSVTTAPTSALSSGNRVPHIILHPSSLLRPHLRNSSGVSPTESVPVTVSDIHFRHSSDDEPVEPESRRTSAVVGEHPPPHPPLPQRSYTSPFIMQKLFGPQTSPSAGGQSALQTPGAGPSRLRDRDPPPGSPSGSGFGRSAS